MGSLLPSPLQSLGQERRRDTEQDSENRLKKKMKGRRKEEDARDVWELKACAFYILHGEPTNIPKLVADTLLRRDLAGQKHQD